ncbi:phospho-sugar mutase [Paenibacillus cymbidii]|uniref:phospho-sugar mutase n=1 Tax=Paenibacillus cymbidii TaxID=1639034 RepID=UPI001080B64E|nr:phospho-sugar mutase [Paenibacillus cymbidii]
MSETNRVQSLFDRWLDDPGIDAATKAELRAIADQPAEVEDRFYKDLEFGTGGLRGVIGAGTNRMNLYTVGRATQGLAQFLLANAAAADNAVAIAYDSRNQSPEFALEAALVLAGNGIAAYVFDSLRPTPELSFAVRHLGATAGIVVTASHNPPEYNGYKVYGKDGGQLVPHDAERVIAQIRDVAFASIRKLTREQAEAAGLLRWIGREADEAFLAAVTSVSRHAEVVRELGDRVSIVYTPLHGAGNLSVRAALARVGFTNVTVVPEQELPDANFSTVKSPNPEEKEAFALALKLAEQVNADVVIGTDPDCDRMGAVVKDDNGQYVVLNGNQSGALMVHYLLSSMKERGDLPANGVVVKTIVTSEMGAVIAEHYGAQVMNTLTGFKYIGEKMTQFAATGAHTFLFGYEESYGYLAGDYARDKDAVLASMLIAEAAAYYKAQGSGLYDVLQELYRQHGYFLEKLESRTLKGKDGLEQIGRIMDDWRAHPPTEVAGRQVAQVLDYAPGLDGLPPENVLKYVLDDHSWFCLRPSGTEPKIKVYFAVRGQSAEDASARADRLVQAVMSRVDG